MDDKIDLIIQPVGPCFSIDANNTYVLKRASLVSYVGMRNMFDGKYGIHTIIIVISAMMRMREF
jgi:hypothetical protein